MVGYGVHSFQSICIMLKAWCCMICLEDSSIATLNFSMGFNIKAPYKDCVTHKYIYPSVSSNVYRLDNGVSMSYTKSIMFL